MDASFKYIKDKKIHSGQDYPYTGKYQVCQTVSGKQWSITGYVNVPGCDNLINALNKQPVSIAVDAYGWSTYKSGIFSNCTTNVNFAALLVGATDQYWKIKNDWGTKWGESGYIRLTRGNTCGICSIPSYPTI